MRVLVVDDEILIVKTLKHVALLRGHIVRVEMNGQNGLLAWQEFQPHLVFLDLMMPEIDGATLLKSIKKQNEKVVMMSAHDVLLKKVPGVDMYVVKPFKDIVAIFKQAEKLFLCNDNCSDNLSKNEAPAPHFKVDNEDYSGPV